MGADRGKKQPADTKQPSTHKVSLREEAIALCAKAANAPAQCTAVVHSHQREAPIKSSLTETCVHSVKLVFRWLTGLLPLSTLHIKIHAP
jgi:hypothetical protein